MRRLVSLNLHRYNEEAEDREATLASFSRPGDERHAGNVSVGLCTLNQVDP
jgi:hypothetical protein